MLHRRDVTLLIVDNPKLKFHQFAYNIALNITDHLVWYHIWGDGGPWKYVSRLTDEDIKSCKTDYCLIVKIGTYFNSSILFSNLDSKCSLAGHILDKGDDYYEIHDKILLVKVQDYDTTQHPTYRSINRSVDNYHDDYTPLWIKDGGIEIKPNGKLRYGANLISNLIRSGKKVQIFNRDIRGDEAHIYHHEPGAFYHNVRNRPKKFFPVATEDMYPIDPTKYTKVFGCANGLQVLNYIHENTEKVTICDSNIISLQFTEDIFRRWSFNEESYNDIVQKYVREYNVHLNLKYVSDTPDNYFLDYIENRPEVFDILRKIRKGDIHIEFKHTDMLDLTDVQWYCTQNNTIIYYSNILSYALTWYCLPAIDADLLLRKIQHVMKDTSVFIGVVPFIGSTVVYKKDIEINPKLKLPWREELYEYYKERVGVLQSH